MSEPVRYETEPERIYLGEVEPAKRMRARQVCASSKHKFAYLAVDVCASTKEGEEVRFQISDSAAVAKFVSGFLEPQILLKEHFGTLLLDTKNSVVGFAVISVGGLSSASVELPMVFKPALLLPAAGMILVHNHPSGNAQPSSDDVLLTKRVVQGGTLLGFRVLDHIILGSGGKYFSFVENGLM